MSVPGLSPELLVSQCRLRRVRVIKREKSENPSTNISPTVRFYNEVHGTSAGTVVVFFFI